MGAKADRKEATRGRVITAARALFEEVGYEAATIRMIADRAGVSVGSVFTTFDSKVEIFNHILFEKFEALAGELGRISVWLKGSARDRICSIMSIAYGVECRELDLMMAHLGASYGWPSRLEAQHQSRHALLAGLFRGALEHGVRSGEVRADADLDLFVEMLMAVYLRNYRKAYYEDLDATALSAHAERQLGLMFGGVSCAS